MDPNFAHKSVKVGLNFLPGAAAGMLYLTAMATTQAEIVEIQQRAGGAVLLIDLPAGIRPAPGQYLLAAAEGHTDILPVVLYPAGLPDIQAAFLPVEAVNWMPGTRLALRGPFGRGFHLGAESRQVALAALAGSPLRLLPLAHLALERGASVVLHTGVVPEGLPLDVEILPPELLSETLSWADYLALDIAREDLPDLKTRLGLTPFQQVRITAEALVLAPMPCAGAAECGVCAVSARGGYRYACKDGPVIPLRDLLGAA